MLPSLFAALALTASTLSVPFVFQTDALCGGASAAMVLRYWGDAHAGAEQFASLVEHRRGADGIATDALIRAVQAKGWRAEAIDGTFASLESHLDAREPVVVLLAQNHGRYHYVVVVGATADAIVVNDPSWGPLQSMPRQEFARAWSAAQHWALLILPGEKFAKSDDGEQAATPSVEHTSDGSECDRLVDAAVRDIRSKGLDRADDILAPIRERCPESAAPLRELAAVRFGQHRWSDAASLAREALDIDPHDQYAPLVLGASLFMQDDPLGALRAWNKVGKPRLNSVRIEGLRRSRYDVIAKAIGLTPSSLLTVDEFRQARRRLDALPDRSSARLALRPEDDGYASVDVIVAERGGLPRGAADWLGIGVGAAVDREVSTKLPGFSGQGEVWSASWRWWQNRPRVAGSFEAPRSGFLGGIWRVDASWETESYGAADAISLQESRAHGGLTVSDWLTGQVRYSLSSGFDAWSTGLRAASVGAAIERHWRDERLVMESSATAWFPVPDSSSVRSFGSIGLSATARSSTRARGWTVQSTGGVQAVSDDAPLTLWPGAGEGHARGALLRAHPLLDDGVVSLNSESVFGRSLVYVNGEVRRWLDKPSAVRIGVAAFVDVGHARRLATAATSVTQTDVGAGLRLRVPAVNRVLRFDFAHGLADGANAFSVGWAF
ncbi:MAG TPA: papain-like cysteine protease family protein [Vicinamibacterales bacterium]